MNSQFVKGSFAVLAGMALIYLGDMALGVNIEIYRGIATFTFPWVIDVFLVPFIAGVVVSLIYGRHGKWLACLPPLFVRTISFAQLTFFDDSYEYVDLFFRIPLAYWGLCLILVVESANFGGIIGEIMKGVYRLPGRKRKESPMNVTPE
ncbi:hypothetical protein [Candidatus Nitrotoga fabula]|uniref:Uncharacterized protein n=1 Tax=Candidatus Nitrotoga fabula TaxID=2182327 RepID=A0A916BCB6_9PROT|nr:hypothetical protein [Candidatus Nitrotoga fabula]CAE6686895.1 conserved membrane hypothetical protein [Candidatus Nitrotoga fabula]